MTINDAVASRVVNLMRKNKITQYRLEQDSGIVHGAMDRILNGQNKTVTFTTIFKLARGFKMSVIEFLDDEVFNLDT
ncbi:MAG: helix-turn-helix transcriptional regulator, partial [Clostridia bacterium]|nr:helix-turn-helix transcriptional regulator [Clostridia bacterium]